jgi:hypothetical protein
MELITRATHGRPKGQQPPEKRPCRECHAPLASANPSDICAFCNHGDWERSPATNRQLHDLEVGRLEYGLAA